MEPFHKRFYISTRAVLGENMNILKGATILRWEKSKR